MTANSLFTPRVVEIGETTAGIAVPDPAGAVRFFSAQPAFDGLDGRRFRSVEDAARAARAVLRGSPRREPSIQSLRAEEADGPSDLDLADPGPLLLPA
ncbi:MAG: hypothetical protein JO048_15060 [Methylobacteriaceae bacterium]|nr:hypothetical protein [Methylobacteriaceae bacterium]